MPKCQQRVGDVAHHAAFRRKTVPVEHPALIQPRRQINQLAAFQLFLNLQMRDHAAGGSLTRKLHEGFGRIHNMARHATRRQVKVLLQKRLMHIVQMVEGDCRGLKQRRTGNAIREVALSEGF